MSRPVVPVILSGGSGTRLWPLSRADRPKQFLRLTGAESLFQQTLSRLRAIAGGTAPPIVVCNDGHHFLVAEQLCELGVAPGAIELEPAGRNTAPAVAAAALVAESHAAEDPILLVLPADHVVRRPDRFVEAVAVATEAARAGSLVTFGVVPDRPEIAMAESIDYAVMETTAKAAVVPLAAGWSDVGSWAALHDVLDKDAEGNVSSGDVLLESCSNTYAVSTSRLVAAVGVDNVVIVETDDAVLVVAKDEVQRVKQIVEALKDKRR